MKYVTPHSSSIGTPNPRAMRELLDFLYSARQELAARKSQAEQGQALVKQSHSKKSVVVKS